MTNAYSDRELNEFIDVSYDIDYAGNKYVKFYEVFFCKKACGGGPASVQA